MRRGILSPDLWSRESLQSVSFGRAPDDCEIGKVTCLQGVRDSIPVGSFIPFQSVLYNEHGWISDALSPPMFPDCSPTVS